MELVRKLKRADITIYAAKDILRASGTFMAEIKGYDLKKQQEEIKSGIQLSPILLIRDEKNSKLIIADGFHRLCAIFSYDEDAQVSNTRLLLYGPAASELVVKRAALVHSPTLQRVDVATRMHGLFCRLSTTFLSASS